MLTPRTFAIVITGAGLLAGLPVTAAWACDDDRYPCPVRSQALTQETADAPAEPSDPPARPTPSAKPQKKVSHPPRANEKAQGKGERETPHVATHAKVSKPAVQEQAGYIFQKAAKVAPAVVLPPRADQPLNNESRNKNLVAAAATPWPVLPNIEDAGASAPGATGADATQAAAKANPVQLVDPNEVNDLDRTADGSLTANSSWTTYLLLLLGAALAAAAAMCFFSRMTFMQQVRAWIEWQRQLRRRAS
jgi:hypothetical protein